MRFERLQLAARAGLVVFGLAALGWTWIALPVLERSATAQRTADRIVNGERFKSGTLADTSMRSERHDGADLCEPMLDRAKAILSIRIAEETLAKGEAKAIDREIASARGEVLGALACSPADPFLFLALTWIESAQVGFNGSSIAYLRRSYRLGPLEGWVAVKRSRLALPVLERLPSDMADAAIREFSGLVASGLSGEAADVLVESGWGAHDRLVAALAGVPERQRRQFAKALRDRGCDVAVPGIGRPEPRPWQ